MFKAKLIENQNYYQLRRRQFILTIIPSVPIAFLVNFYRLPTWIILLAVGLYSAITFLIINNQKRMQAITGNKNLEMDKNEIRIKSIKNNKQESIKLDDVDKVMIKQEYTLPFERMKEIPEEWKETPHQNYVVLFQGDKSRKLEFEIDSYYRINQLNKVIETWRNKGYKIEIAQ